MDKINNSASSQRNTYVKNMTISALAGGLLAIPVPYVKRKAEIRDIFESAKEFVEYGEKTSRSQNFTILEKINLYVEKCNGPLTKEYFAKLKKMVSKTYKRTYPIKLVNTLLKGVTVGAFLGLIITSVVNQLNEKKKS